MMAHITMMVKAYSALFLLCVFSSRAWAQYAIPKLEFQALSPRGLRVELEDQPGVELFAFHGKLNNRLDASKEGDITGEAHSPTNGKWVFEDSNLELSVGDKIYYWVYVQYNRAGYTNRDQVWEVTELGSSSLCNPSQTIATDTDGQICAGKIFFEDEFNQPRVDTSKWIVEHYIPSMSDDDHYEFVSYQNKDANRFIRNSILYLKPIAAASKVNVYGILDLTQGCTRTKSNSCYLTQVGGFILPPVTSAKIRSKMSFRYGKIVVKAKLPIGDWIYPQIELIPKNTLPAYPKILIAYSRGNANLSLSNDEEIGNTLLFGGPVNTPEEPQRSRNLRSRRLLVPSGRDMRTYTLTWSPTRIDVMVDSDQYGTILAHEYSGFDTEYQISLGVGVGGNYDFPDDVRSGNFQKPWRNLNPRTMYDFFLQKNFWISTWRGDDVAMQIDSVKVWAV